MTAYYNEHDPFAAAWLRELIKDGLIAPGDVDERSIEDVTPADVANYTQCHFFAGIGGWSYALRLAGWPDDRPVWTGSAPCQPFSAAGKGGGLADERHLWPAFFWLIRQCRPDAIFGEQVSSKAGLEWLDIVSADLEAAGYGVGAFDLCAPSVGAFHIRQRLYFVADAQGVGGREGQPNFARGGKGSGTGQGSELISNGAGQMANPSIAGVGKIPAGQGRPEETTADIERRGGFGHVGHTDSRKRNGSGAPGPQRYAKLANDGHVGHASSTEFPPRQQKELPGAQPIEERRAAKQPGGAFWAGAQWIICRDGKARPIEPGISPLAYGVSGQVVVGSAIQEPAATFSETEKGKKVNRVGTLRGAGNAVVPQLAAEFIRAYIDIKQNQESA